MPYAAPFYRLSITGTFGPNGTTPSEYWSAGLHIATKTGSITDPLAGTAFLAGIAPAVQTFHSTVALQVGSTCFLKELTGAFIGTNGRYVVGDLQATDKYTYPSPVAGGGTAKAPWSSAVVLTLRSLRLRGPGSHGRCYYPCLVPDINAGIGNLASGFVDSWKTASVTMLNAINAQAASKFGTGWNVALVSQVGAGVTEIVNRVGIGQRVDSMESRERNIPESHVFGNLTVSTTLEADQRRELGDRLRDELEREVTED